MSPVHVEGLGGGVHVPEPEAIRPAAPVASGESRLPLRHLAREAARMLRVSRVGIWRLEEGAEGLRGLVRFDRTDNSIAEDLVFGPEMAVAFRRFLFGVDAVPVNDVRETRGEAPLFDEWAAAQGVRAILVVPVHVEGRLRGFVTFEEGRAPREWTKKERDLATALAQQTRDALRAGAPPSIAPPVPPPPPRVAPVPTPPVPALPAPASAKPAHSVPTSPVPELAAPASPAVERSAASTARLPGSGLRALLRRLPPVEIAAILAAERADELIRDLEVQSGTLGLLDGAAIAPEDAELVREARAASERVRLGLADFLAHLRRGAPRPEPTDLSHLIGGLVPALAREAGEVVRLRVAPSADPIPVTVDPGLLERALLHLVRNAREASPSGGDVRISWCRVPAPAGGPADEPHVARIRVEDRGEGIPEAELPWLFEPFFSARRPGGPLRGLGLSVVQAVVEGEGGWVEVSSRVGEGTRVDLHLPVAAEARSSTSAPESARASASAAGIPLPPRVLLLEDEPLLARLVERTLTRSGFEVEVASAPVEAERRLLRMGRVDVVVAERTLAGGRSGVDAVRRWREERPDLRLVVLDRRVAPGETAPEIPEAPVLTRPFEPHDVLAAVREVLARPEAPDDEVPFSPEGPGTLGLPH